MAVCLGSFLLHVMASLPTLSWFVPAGTSLQCPSSSQPALTFCHYLTVNANRLDLPHVCFSPPASSSCWPLLGSPTSLHTGPGPSPDPHQNPAAALLRAQHSSGSFKPGRSWPGAELHFPANSPSSPLLCAVDLESFPTFSPPALSPHSWTSAPNLPLGYCLHGMSLNFLRCNVLSSKFPKQLPLRQIPLLVLDCHPLHLPCKALSGEPPTSYLHPPGLCPSEALSDCLSTQKMLQRRLKGKEGVSWDGLGNQACCRGRSVSEWPGEGPLPTACMFPPTSKITAQREDPLSWGSPRQIPLVPSCNVSA